MSFSSKNVMRYLHELAFERFAGTKGEDLAARKISELLSDMGYKVVNEPFSVTTYDILKAEIIVSGKHISCVGVGLSKSTDDEGIEGELYFADALTSSKLRKCKDKVLLYSGSLYLEDYKKLMKFGPPKALIRVENTPGKEPIRTNIPREWWKYGNLPIVRISYENALLLLKAKPKKVKVILKQRIYDSVSKNIVIIKEGTTFPDEEILIGAHYDSEKGTIGACDNLGGTALLIELARVFHEKDFKRSLRIVFFGAEELGLIGSRVYVERHKNELSRIKLMVNLDVHGQAFGSLSCIIMGNNDMKQYIDFLAKELGVQLNTVCSIVSSDSASFSAKGVPSFSFLRTGGAAFLAHTSRDSIEYLTEESFESIGKLLEEFLRRLLNAEEIPFKREIPQGIKEKLKKFFNNRLGVEKFVE